MFRSNFVCRHELRKPRSKYNFFKNVIFILITGRDMFYSRALEIVQDEEYLDESDFDEIRLRYKRHIQVNNHNELMTSKKKIRSKRQSEVVTNGKKIFYIVNPLARDYPLGLGIPSGWLPSGGLPSRGYSDTLWGLSSGGYLLGATTFWVTLLAYVNCKMCCR